MRNAIRIRKQVDSETLPLPELRPMIGHTVEIIVLDETPPAKPTTASPYDPLFDLAGQDVVDPQALQELRAASMT